MSDATPRRCRLVFSSRLVRSCIHSLLLALLLGLPPLVAKERQDLASELPDDTVVCVDVPSIPYLARHTATTSFGRILTHPRVAPIARSALESLEPKYFAPYRAVLGIPSWRLLRSYHGGFRYLITFSDDNGFQQTSIFTTQSVEAARSLAERIAGDHRDAGGESSREEHDRVTVTVLARKGYHPERYLVVDGVAVILATALQDAVLGSARSAAKVAEQPSSGVATEWKTWLRRSQDELRSRKPAATMFVHARRLFDKQPMFRFPASILLGPDFDGWKFLHGSIEFPAHPYSMLVRVKLNRTSEQRGALGPIAWGSGSTSVPNWVPASASSAMVVRIDPQRTWDRIAERSTRPGSGSEGDDDAARSLSQSLVASGIGLSPETITGRVTVVRWFDTTVTTNAKSLLLGVELTRPGQFRRRVRDIVSRNRDRIESKRYRSINYFVFRQPFRIELDDPTRPTLAKWSSPESPILRRPSNCFAVIGTDLVYSDNVNALKQAIEATHSPTDRLNELLSFRLVRTHLRRSRSSTIVGESYWDPSEGWRNLHSLLTKDEMLSAIKNYRNPFIQVSTLSNALERRKEIRFHEIAKYIAPCGSVILVSGNDIEWKFIMLARDSARK